MTAFSVMALYLLNKELLNKGLLKKVRLKVNTKV